jgi:signal peptidase I
MDIQSSISSTKRRRASTIITSGIRGSSMAPLINERSGLIIDSADKKSFSLGDIIVFIKEDRVIAHRIIRSLRGKKEVSFIVKGDNNLKIDGMIKKSEILGKVIKIKNPKYEINLDNTKNKIIKYIFLIYSLLILKFPNLSKYRLLFFRIRKLKSFFIFLMRSNS